MAPKSKIIERDNNWYWENTVEEEVHTCPGYSLNKIFWEKQFIFFALFLSFKSSLIVSLEFKIIKEVNLFIS